MRRTFGIGVLLLLILGGIAIGLGAYHAGVNHGLSEAANSRVVHVVDSGEGGGLGFLFFIRDRRHEWLDVPLAEKKPAYREAR